MVLSRPIWHFRCRWSKGPRGTCPLFLACANALAASKLAGDADSIRVEEMSDDAYLCPTCDSEVAVGGQCPVCAPVPKRPRRRQRKVVGATRKAWEQDEVYDGLNLPDSNFDYDEFIAKELSTKPHRKIGIKFYWWLTAIVLVGLFVWLAV
jgi:hypothetical protein